jgi:methyltransferase family protein
LALAIDASIIAKRSEGMSDNDRIFFPRKFEIRVPTPQNAVDIFENAWASDLGEVVSGISETGPGRYFGEDPRPRWAAHALGRNGRFEGMRVLELGPLEGAHTYQIEKLGAREILAIEANVEAYLKCLVVKEITGLQRAKFVLGDFVEYLKMSPSRFDVIFCSNVLYHLQDPIEVIRLMAQMTDKVFCSTHYYDEAHYPGPLREKEVDPRYPGVNLYVHHRRPEDGQGPQFWGGNRLKAVWLPRQDILNSFRDVGLSNTQIFQEDVDHPNGASIIFTASRSRTRRPIA